ncbi:MAG: PhoPQ-activated pathogenicity-related family protein [Bryobacteraceae bacterium]|nr:PhoPQ-activated pathogenicity-related family protein [Bryobacteraceae bacterium]
MSLARFQFLFLPFLLAAQQTALDRYVAAPDPAYQWKVARTFRQKGVDITVIDLTSQRWRAGEVTPAEWKHRLTIASPPQWKHRTAFLYIAEGSNGEPDPKKANVVLPYLAKWTGTVVAELRMVPNQPLQFAGENGRRRTEDEIVAYTWTQFLKTGDETWPIRLPMTKAAVRAMDTVSAVMKPRLEIDNFVVAGVSKRGWTTWLAAAVDPRVAAIIPIVIDGLNLLPTLKEHYQAYGAWSAAIRDYHETGFLDQLGTPAYFELMKIEEPYSYRARYRMPKFLINAAGDQFFLPDSTRFYFGDLPGEKHLRYIPNADHGLSGKTFDALRSVVAFYQSILNGAPRPEFEEEFRDGTLMVRMRQGSPVKVKLWQAVNPRDRDFRLQSIGKAYKPRELKPVRPGEYEARISVPPAGWTAFFAELEFPKTGRYPLRFTTQVRVLPEKLPFDEPRNGSTRVETPVRSRVDVTPPFAILKL